MIRVFAVDASPLVSVVVPVFNGAPFLRESLESILAQTHGSLEVIVMDDASTDASATIAAEVTAGDERARVHSHPANRGQFANVNAGIAEARGEFVAVFHADDVYEPELVARQVDFLRAHPGAAAVFALATLIDADGAEFGRLEAPAELAGLSLLEYPVVLNAVLRHSSTFLPTPSAMVRRSVYEEVGAYAEEYGIRGDLDMWLRIASGYPVGLLREHLFHYRVGDHNESRRYARTRSELDPSFEIVDRRLAAGDRRHAEPGALATYAALRARDRLLAARNAYVLGRRDDLRELLDALRVGDLRGAPRADRLFLGGLLASLRLLARLPHSDAVGRRLAGSARPRTSR